MSIIKKGTDFGPTEQVTSTKLDNLVDNASFTDTNANAVAYTGSTGTCLNGGGLEVTSAGQLQIKDSDISTAKLADDAVTPAKTSFIDETTGNLPAQHESDTKASRGQPTPQDHCTVMRASPYTAVQNQSDKIRIKIAIKNQKLNMKEDNEA